MANERKLAGLVLTLVAASALTAGAVAFRSATPPRAERAEALPSSGKSGFSGAELRSAGEAATVQARAYELAFEQEVATGQGPPSRVRVRGKLEIAPRDTAGRDLVRLGPVAIEGDGTPAPAELAVIFARVRDASGHLVAIEVPESASEVARRYLQALAGALEHTIRSGAEWESLELDVGGRFASSYRRLADGRVERYRRRFVDHPAQTGPASAVRLDGRTFLTLDGDGGVASLATDERAEISAGAWRMNSRLVVSLRREGEGPARWVSNPGALERLSIFMQAAPERPSAETDRERVAGRSFADLRAELESLDELDESIERTRGRTGLMKDLAALLRRDPAALREATERLKASETAPSERQLLAGSLAAAGTPEASHALGEVLKSAPLPDARLQAAVSLNVSSAHDDETLAVLEAGMADTEPDVANASTLALGSALRTHESSGGRHPDSTEALARAYADASSSEDRIRVLGAVGNSGDTSLLPLVEHALADPNPIVVETATYALRFMGPSADPLLVRSLGSAFPDVRGSAVRAIQFRSVDALRPALETALARESSADLRGAMQRLLLRAA
jgi:hypothetical protein